MFYKELVELRTSIIPYSHSVLQCAINNLVYHVLERQHH